MRLTWPRLIICASIPLVLAACERPRRGAMVDNYTLNDQSEISGPKFHSGRIDRPVEMTCVGVRTTFSVCFPNGVEVGPPISLADETESGGEPW